MRADSPDKVQSPDLTLLLNRMGQGDREAADQAAAVKQVEASVNQPWSLAS